jgi:transmembrane 9 superfamily protein 3
VFIHVDPVLALTENFPPPFLSQIHWFSIFNSFMMVIFLTGLVSMILMRTLRNDYAKYAREDDDLESLVMVL